MSGWTLQRRINETSENKESLSRLFESWYGDEERWLFISPHDDDIVVGAGILVVCAVEHGVHCSMRIATDGSMGYCDLSEKDSITRIRKDEAQESFSVLGVTDVEWLGFADNDLYRFAGRRPAQAGDPGVISGYTGLQNAMTSMIRTTRPTRIFVPGLTDFHPDHKLVYQELLISIFHASGEIWPELGKPLEEIPDVYELAVYYRFLEPPNLKITAPAESFQKKLDAIRCYRSQRQIERTISSIEESGPVEYYRDIEFGFYSPMEYEGLF